MFKFYLLNERRLAVGTADPHTPIFQELSNVGDVFMVDIVRLTIERTMFAHLAFPCEGRGTAIAVDE